MEQTPVTGTSYDTATIMGGLYGEGIIACKGAFTPEWVARLRQDIQSLFAEALNTPGGAVPRGPNRYYVETHPQRISGFLDVVTHPWFVAVCESTLGPGYRVVELGFDVSNPGSMNQPWHRDFPTPDNTRIGRRLDSLAFNIPTQDIEDILGPFEIAPGTQWDDLAMVEDGMFPPESMYPRYQERAVRKLPKAGDMSARSALTIHRGTANRGQVMRPILVVGVDAPDGINHLRHDLQVTQDYYDAMPDAVRKHLNCRVVDKLEPIIQRHTIEGLLMGVPSP